MSKIKVLHAIGGGEIGGAEELVLTLMKLLDREKYEPHLLCLCPGPFAELAREQGFSSETIAMRHRLDISAVAPVREYMRCNNIDIVHTHGVRANLVVRLAARKEGLPVVTTVHSILRYDYDSAFKAVFARFLTVITNKNTDKFIAISGAVEKDIKRMGVLPEKIEVIHNGLDIAKFSQPREAREVKRELGLHPDKPVVTVVARLHPVKGHEYFLHAARKVLDTGLEAQFLIIGEGISRKKLKKLIEKLKLDGAVRMPGYYSPIEDIYGVSDVVCVPSVMEGLGMVVLEAMYFGVPVVASNTGGIPEIIEDRVDGLLVPPRNSQSLAYAIMRVLVDTDLAGQLTRRGREKVRGFTLENMARKVEKIYQDVRRET